MGSGSRLRRIRNDGELLPRDRRPARRAGAGRRWPSGSWRPGSFESHSKYFLAEYCVMQQTGKLSLPMPNVMSVYGFVGFELASAIFSAAVGSRLSSLRRATSSWNMNTSYSFHVTSCFPIQNGEISTSCCGPSSSPRFSSESGLPIVNLPPLIGSISNSASESLITSR